ncbi:MAG: hypothetical protein HC888_14880, partial [Candidatus Competibacteraceae bacterium]|nr:hypothetical protein [Candidatus Competibacteraceae bacterium]
MPLPLYKRFGITGIKTPCFTNQLGIFSPNLISSEKIYEFFNAIPQNYRFIDLNINKFNKLSTKKFNVNEKTHFELDLIKPYEKIQKIYSDELKQRLEISQKSKLTVVKGIQPADFISMLTVLQPSYCSDEDQVKLIRMLISTSIRYRFGELFGVYDKYNVLSSAASFSRKSAATGTSLWWHF